MEVETKQRLLLGQIVVPANNMVPIPGGTFRMGSDNHFPEEAPAHLVHVDPFWIDKTPITNLQFRTFVKATGHVTFAELLPDPEDHPDALPHMIYAGSFVFEPPVNPANLRDRTQWWTFLKGADWRHPHGPNSSIDGLDDHPVVHIGYSDALIYARWTGKHLPTEAEWEFAALGGPESAEYTRGDKFTQSGKLEANTRQGEFPHQHLVEDGFGRTSSVEAFPPNAYGVHDMIGNVWEWTGDWYSPKHTADLANACSIPQNPRGGLEAASLDPRQPSIRIPRKVIKGGSHLCAPNDRRRWRPAARHAEAVDTSTSDLGFRCVLRVGPTA